jgi:hypothetical protein
MGSALRTAEPRAFVPLLLLGTVSQSVVYGDIRLATASVWPAWAMHTIGNARGIRSLIPMESAVPPGVALSRV